VGKFHRRVGKGKVAVIEPNIDHYYQPMWTLVGGGSKSLKQSVRPLNTLLPKSVNWIRDSVASFQPEENRLTTQNGDSISYDYLVVAVGLQLRYDKIKGLNEALNTPGVCSNYSHLHVEKTTEAIKNFKSGGNALFTFPNSPIKCAGAPQKIMYIAEESFRLSGKTANVQYFTALPVLFGVVKYANALWEIVNKRNISVNLRHNLIEVKPTERLAVFENLDTKEQVVKPYDMLHVAPYMNTPDMLAQNKQLANSDGFLEVDKFTLQHVRYSNIFGIGDCTNIPTAKTAAAVAAQLGILDKNLGAVMEGKQASAKYDGYTSCPLVTGKSTCVLAEFDFQTPPQPLETFPFNQAKERRTMYFLKAHVMPHLYFLAMVRGWWNGPGIFRKAMRLGIN